jgi:hypothetical protein
VTNVACDLSNAMKRKIVANVVYNLKLVAKPVENALFSSNVHAHM